MASDNQLKKYVNSRHINQPRISAEVLAKLIAWKNELSGKNNSIYEEHLIAEEKNEQLF